MGAIASGSVETTKTYERIESGVYPARCIAVIELGTHPNTHPKAKPGDVKREIELVWELSELMQDGRPFIVSKTYTNILTERSALFKDLTAWRGKAFTTAELVGFAMSNVLDKCCMLNVSLETSSKGNPYNKVTAIMPLPKGLKCDERVNDLIDFGIGDVTTPEFDKIKGYSKIKIKESLECKSMNFEETTYKEEPVIDVEDDGEETPF